MRCAFYFIPYSPSRILAPGCKRLMIDNNYLSALSRPNLTPIFDRITKFTENGILTSKGKRPLFVVSLFILDSISHRRKHDV
jgi:cation diffusion facilitator CzcD-associated flavoprotein CzcO